MKDKSNRLFLRVVVFLGMVLGLHQFTYAMDDDPSRSVTQTVSGYGTINPGVVEMQKYQR